MGRHGKVIAGRRTELVAADQLRPGDVIPTDVGDVVVRGIARDTTRTFVRTDTRTLTVTHCTRFRRVHRSARIDMRPDLTKGQR